MFGEIFEKYFYCVNMLRSETAIFVSSETNKNNSYEIKFLIKGKNSNGES